MPTKPILLDSTGQSILSALEAKTPILEAIAQANPVGKAKGIASDFSASTAYAAGDYVFHDGTLYRFTADHAAGAWIGTDAVAAITMDDLVSVRETLYDTASVAYSGAMSLNAGDFEQGQWSYSKKTASAKRIRCNRLIPVTEGSVLTVYHPTLDLYIGRLATPYSASYEQNVYWSAASNDPYVFTATGDGYLTIILRGGNDSGADITVADYDCTISMLSASYNELNTLSGKAVQSGGVLPDGTDLNSLFENRLYLMLSANSYYHSPASSTTFLLEILNSKANVYNSFTEQRCYSFSGKTYTRMYKSSDSTWTEWVENVVESDISPLTKFPVTATVYSASNKSRAETINVTASEGDRIFCAVTEWGGADPSAIFLRGWYDDSHFDALACVQNVGEIMSVTAKRDYIYFTVGFNVPPLEVNTPRTIAFQILTDDNTLPYLTDSPLRGKYLSILGASMSTFEGYIPEGYTKYYPHETTSYYPVISVHDTYWGKTMDALGLKLLVNNSSSGAFCSTGHGSDSMAGCGDRSEALDDGVHSPDIIVVQQGSNDFTRSTGIGEYDGTQAMPVFETDTDTFREAYALMLNRIMTKYPRAIVVCETLPMCKGGVYITNTFPPTSILQDAQHDAHRLEDFNNAIREVASLFGAKVCEINRCGYTFQNVASYAQDNVGTYSQHPNAFGHSLFANELIKTLDPSCKLRYATRILEA